MDFLKYGELLAAVTGTLSSLLLALPLRHEIRASKRFKRLSAQTKKGAGNARELEQIRQQFLNEKLEAYTRFEAYALWGFILLFLSFAISTVLAVAKTLKD